MGVNKLRWHIQKIFPSVYDDSLSYYELLSKIIAKLNEVVEDVNEFTSQDIEKMVSDILNEWYANGKLSDIITNDVLSEIQSKAYYNVESQMGYDDTSKTWYYITKIPHKDERGNIIPIKRSFANDMDTMPSYENRERATNFAYRNKTTLTINASVGDAAYIPMGHQIQNGVVLRDQVHEKIHTLAISDDMILKSFPPNVTSQDILNAGYKTALGGFCPIIQDGKNVSESVLNTYPEIFTKMPRHIICQERFTNDIIIFDCDGRRDKNVGMDYNDIIRVLTPLDLEFAMLLDGGGSATTVVGNVMVNGQNDNNFKSERAVPDFLYWSRPIKEKDRNVYDLSKVVGNLYNRVNDLTSDVFFLNEIQDGVLNLKADEGVSYQGIAIWEGDTRKTKLNIRPNGEISYFDFGTNTGIFNITVDGDIQTRKGAIGGFFNRNKTATDLNGILASGQYWATSTTLNMPASGTYIIEHHQYQTDDTALQKATGYRNFDVWYRRKENDVWSEWTAK